MKKRFSSVFVATLLVMACSGRNSTPTPTPEPSPLPAPSVDCSVLDADFDNQISVVTSMVAPSPYPSVGWYCTPLSALVTAQGYIDALNGKPEASCQKVTDLGTEIASLKDRMSKIIDDELPHGTYCQPALTMLRHSHPIMDFILPSAHAIGMQKVCASLMGYPPVFQNRVVANAYNSRFACAPLGLAASETQKYFAEIFAKYLIAVYSTPNYTGSFPATKTESEINTAVLDTLTNNTGKTVGFVIGQ